MPTAHIFIASSLDGRIACGDGVIGWLLTRDDPGEDHSFQASIRDKDSPCPID